MVHASVNAGINQKFGQLKVAMMMYCNYLYDEQQNKKQQTTTSSKYPLWHDMIVIIINNALPGGGAQLMRIKSSAIHSLQPGILCE